MPAMLDSIAQAVRGEKVLNAAAAASSSLWEKTADADSMMPSVRTLGKLAVGGAQVLLGHGGRAMGTFTQSCPMPQLSCHNTTVVENLCCFNAPGGQLLQTQFWDTAPATGPADSWTLHGLWPDRCDGSFEANCDSTRVYKNISAILSSSGATPLLSYMSTYWKDYKGDDESFWEHEWAKHGTCISTLNPDCYADHKPTEEVVDYFQKAVDLFKALPSYEWLAAAGITPTTSKTYTTAQIQSAIQAKRPGVSVTLGCKSSALNEIWYHYDVRGPLQTGTFVPANPDGTKSTCPASGIRYLPKNGAGGSPPPHHTTTTTAPGSPSPSDPPITQPGTPFSGRGSLAVLVDGATTGCVISKGTWYATGTCATFTAAAAAANADANAFTLSSSKGTCAVVAGALRCDGGKASTVFTNSGGRLAAGGNAAWSAEAVARGSVQQVLYAGGEHGVGVGIEWRGV